MVIKSVLNSEEKSITFYIDYKNPIILYLIIIMRTQFTCLFRALFGN